MLKKSSKSLKQKKEKGKSEGVNNILKISLDELQLQALGVVPRFPHQYSIVIFKVGRKLRILDRIFEEN